MPEVNNRLDTTEENISECNNKAVGTFQNQLQEEKTKIQFKEDQ